MFIYIAMCETYFTSYQLSPRQKRRDCKVPWN